jgi:hypothetical protein
MTRRPSLKLLESAMTEIALPTTKPAILESATQRLTWKREIQNADDEIALIREQVQSAERINMMARTEAEIIHAARVKHADAALDREYTDAGKVLAATRASLEDRISDLERMKAGLTAAVGATD